MAPIADDQARIGGRIWFVAGYAGLTGFLALVAAIREPGTAPSVSPQRGDRGTTAMIIAAYASAAGLAPTLRRIGPRALPRAAGPTGVALQVGGLALRAWSMRTLGRSYSRTLRADDRQAVVDAGPYSLIRHPGYAGSLMVWAGFGLASRSSAVLALAAALLGPAYRRRIVAEEALLSRELPSYSGYAAQTKRLIPFVW